MRRTRTTRKLRAKKPLVAKYVKSIAQVGQLMVTGWYEKDPRRPIIVPIPIERIDELRDIIAEYDRIVPRKRAVEDEPKPTPQETNGERKRFRTIIGDRTQ